MSESPKVTVYTNDEGDPRVFVDNDEIPFAVWDVKAELGWGRDVKVTIEFPASAVEFKEVD